MPNGILEREKSVSGGRGSGILVTGACTGGCGTGTLEVPSAMRYG